jgi:outer membrane receptor protein involved in Fe transport
MKKFFLFIFSALLFFTSSAQQTGTVTGKIFEQSTKLPLQFVFVNIIKAGDTLGTNGAVTNEEGVFKIDSLADGTYSAVVAMLGFDTIHTSSFSVSAAAPVADLGKIYMSASGVLLGNVDIKEEKEAFVSTIDRKIYYPEKDITAQSGSASEILQNVPSVTVDADGNLSLRGSANVTILINGKPSQLMNNNAAAALEQIPASSIERIEIITNPSAKYKPDGVAGIINIVLKKNAKLGFNGSASVNVTTKDRYNGNLTLNYSTGKYTVYASYGYRQHYNKRLRTDTRTFRDSLEASPSDFFQTSISRGRNFSHTFDGGFDYNFNKSNSLSLEGNFLTARSPRTQDISTLITDTSGTTSDYSTTRNDEEDEYEGEGSLSFEHLFKKEDHELSFDFGWGNYGELETSHFKDLYNYPAASSYEGRNKVRKFGNDYTAEIAYTNPLTEDMELELGYEGEYNREHLFFTSDYFDVPANEWRAEAGKNNTFRFDQDVHALYSTYTVDIDDLSIEAGLRAEQTFIISNLETLDSIIPDNYFKLFPTVHFLYELDDDKQLSLSYSKRINRPDPDELNPFPEIKDPRNIESGNPNLKPEQVHSVEMGYQFKNQSFTFIPSLYYHYTYDAFTELTYYINDSVLLTTQQNLATDQSAGLELVFAWKYKKRATINLSSNIYYNTIDASNLGYSGTRSAFAYDAKLAGNLNAWKNTKFQLNANYRSSMLTAQGTTKAVFFVNAGLRQDVFKRRGSIIMSASDIFNTRHWVEEIDTPLLKEEVISKRTSQYVFVGFTWRFGMLAKRNANEIQFENDK